MIKVAINKAIARLWGISESEISEQLKSATPGEEIEITINSPGGEVYEGIAIFDLIREYAKTHNITVKINGLAASMASYIAIAARTINKKSKIIVSENSIYLIHNPWNIIIGDYREMQKAADYLEKLAAMSGSTYAYISGKTEKEIRNLMDVETYFVGNEIIDNGFANEFDQINKADNGNENQGFELDRNALIINARLQIEKTAEKLRATSKADLERAVALIMKTNKLTAEAPAGIDGLELAPDPYQGNALFNSNPKEGENMDKEELKKKYPDLYAAIYNEGREAGEKEERDRVSAHLKLGEDSGSMKIAAQFIRDGNSVMENKVQAEYLSARMNNGALNARAQDNPPAVNTNGNSNAADDAAMEKAWLDGLAGKEIKGGK